MRFVRLVLMSCLLLGAYTLHAQYFQFSQYNFSVQRVNPAWIGLTSDALVDFAFRNQKTGGDFQINTNFLSVAYPFVRASTGKPLGGIGFSVMSDKSGPLFKSQEASATLAVNIPTGRYQNLSVGFKVLTRWQRINTEGLFTGAQYLEGHGFNPALDNGEIPKPFQNRFITFSSGLLWQETNRKGVLQKQLGFSFFDFNQPSPTFLDGSQDELPSTVIVHGAWRIYQNQQLGILPEFILTHSSSKNVLTGGGRFEYVLGKSKDQVDVLIKYAVGRSGIFGLQFHRENYSIGFSYDFPIGDNVANMGAFEVGLEYRTPVDPRSKRELARKRNAKKKKTSQAKRTQNGTPEKKQPLQKKTGELVSAKKDSSSIVPIDSVSDKSVEIVKLDSITDRSKSNPEVAAGNINHEPLLIEKITLHFRFKYNSIELDDETEQFLLELTNTLLENTNLSVQIIGHTDNVGPPHLNQRLSIKRAEAVKAYMTKAGVAPDRVITQGKGMNEPLNNNATETERAHNRRVEIKLFRP